MARSRIYPRLRRGLAVTMTFTILFSVGLLGGCGNMIDRIAGIGNEPKMDPIENPQNNPNYQPVNLPMPLTDGRSAPT